MKKPKFVRAQIVFTLRQANTDMTVAEVCHKIDINEPPTTARRKSTTVKVCPSYAA
jgi:hypothetical protein